MDAVCGSENWDVIIIEEKGNVLATLPYYIKPAQGGFEIRKAPLTQNNGVYFYYPEGLKYDRKIAFEHRVLDKIIDEIEALNLISYRQYFHYSFENWLPFYWRGYSQSTRYTYVIEDTSNIESLIEGFNGNIRKGIRKAEKIVQVFEDLCCEDFYFLNKKTYERQGMGIPYSYQLFERVYEVLKEQKTLKVLYTKDREGNIHSAVLLAEDKDSIYYLISGTDERYRSSQSLTLLIYEGIRLASEKKKKFDFEGSMKKNIEKFFRQFGALQKPYFDIRKDYSLNSYSKEC